MATARDELEPLRDPTVSILAAHEREGLGAGAIANRTGSVVGVSNVFTTTIALNEVWADLPAAVGDVFPSTPLVGYERGDDLHAARDSGFAAIGPLRIWLRPGR